MADPTPEARRKAEAICMAYTPVYAAWGNLKDMIEEALTEATQAHPDCHSAALCDGPEQARAHAEHLTLCVEASAKATRERLQLEDRIDGQEAVILSGTAALQGQITRVEEQAREIERLNEERGKLLDDFVAKSNALADCKRATWQAAAKNDEADACRVSCLHDHCAWLKTAAARARVAAQGGAE